MRRLMGMALAASLWLGYGSATNAQMMMGYTPYTSPYVSVGVSSPYGYSAGAYSPYGGATYYSSGYAGVGSPYSGATYYNSGYAGVGSPLTTYYPAPAVGSYYGYGYPAYGSPYVYRRGLLGGYRLRRW